MELPSSLFCCLPSPVYCPSSGFSCPTSIVRCPASFFSRLASGIRRPSSGFTLIELLMVMVVAIILMSLSLPAYINLGRGAGMRVAVNNVRSTIALSRQWAITRREEITFVTSSTGLVFNSNGQIVLATNDHACYYALNTGTLVQSITDLPLDVTFLDDSSVATNLIFKTDGGLASGATKEKIVLVDKKNSLVKRTISITGLTGGITVE